jgi:putative membrane protein
LEPADPVTVNATVQATVNGLDGFLGTRASLMLDVVFLAMFAVVPVLALSIRQVKSRLNYQLHRTIQLALGLVLLVAVTAFEVDMRFFTDWEARAVGSPYYQPEGWSPVWISLAIHLLFAIPTLLIWVAVILLALRRFPKPPVPSDHSNTHRRLGWLATIGMTLTSATGWVFYWLAFVAS